MQEVDGELQLGSKYVLWKLKIKRAKEEFKRVLLARMDWIRQRLTPPDKEEIKEKFIEMVQELSAKVPAPVKESDEAL